MEIFLPEDLSRHLLRDRIICELYSVSIDIGVDSYLTGGFLRDLFLSSIYPREYDIAIKGDARLFCLKLEDRIKIKFFLLDRERGVYRILVSSKVLRPEEVQIDMAPITGDILDDLGRRDFTINAIAISIRELFDRKGVVRVIDPFNGVNDIKDRCLKALGREVFLDDPIRLLRAVRISALTGVEVERETENWIRESSFLLKRSSKERIRDELFSILNALESWRDIERLNNLGLLREVLPVKKDKIRLVTIRNVDRLLTDLNMFNNIRNELIKHLERLVGNIQRSGLLKFAALLHDLIAGLQVTDSSLLIDKRDDILSIGEGLKVSKRGIKLVTDILLNHHVEISIVREGVSERAMAAFFREWAENGIELLLFSLVDPSIRNKKGLQSVIKRFVSYYFYSFSKKPLPPLVNGEDIMELLNIPPGKHIGQMLKQLNKAEQEGKISSRDEAISFLKEIYFNHE